MMFRTRLPRGLGTTLLFVLVTAPLLAVSDPGRADPTRTRVLNLEGAHNFRDLGGYRTADGQQVKWGLLYRSGQLSHLTNADKSHLRQLGIRRVCDLRTEEERLETPSRLPDEAQVIPECGGNPATNFMQVKTLINERGINNVDWERFMIDSYRAIALDYAHQYRTLFLQLAKPEQSPLLFHCTAGKDRTGFGAALVLLALGVSEETVFSDYLLTNQLTSAIPTAYHEIKSHAPELFEARRDFLQGALSVIYAKYVGLESYLRDGLGMSPQQLAQMRSNLLVATEQ